MAEATRRSTHRLYIDDSGTKEYSPDGRYDAGNTRYFVLGGVLTAIDAAREMVTVIQSVKERHFGVPDVEVKSNWLRIPKERKKHYLDQYDMSEENLHAFVEASQVQ